jgi:hypothetical protein
MALKRILPTIGDETLIALLPEAIATGRRGSRHRKSASRAGRPVLNAAPAADVGWHVSGVTALRPRRGSWAVPCARVAGGI